MIIIFKKNFEILLNKNDFYLNVIKNLDKYEIEYIENYPLITNVSQKNLNDIKKAYYVYKKGIMIKFRNSMKICFQTPNITYNEKLNKLKNVIFYSKIRRILLYLCFK